MTHEQAKEIVKRIKGYMDGGECWSESEFMAMDMAIKALSQEPCDDAISRQAVLAIAHDTCLDLNRYDDTEEFCDEIKELPSVTQKSETVTEFADRCRECGARYGKLLKRKKGHWISHYDEDEGVGWYECDRCHTERAFSTRFCPDCGACMREGRTLDEFIEDSKESEE